ncbi:MAG: 2-oxoacid:acceptor oxidoreductase family protein [Candidatus Odinarchaeia archaeon]
MWEITFLGRGGQGAVTAANALAKAAYSEGFFDVQAFPFFGAERRGAPVRAYARISTSKIYDNSQIITSDILVVLDHKLLFGLDVTHELKTNGFLIVNSSEVDFSIMSNKIKIFTVDATRIALDLNLTIAGFPVVNTPMLGAFVKATKLVSLENLLIAIQDMWPKKFLEKNVAAIKQAYSETKEMSL